MSEMVHIESNFTPPAPGEVLKQKLLQDRGIKQRHLARALGISEPRLNMMFKGRCLLSAEIALRIERVFGISPHYWLRIRDEYELWQERQRLSGALAALKPMDERDPSTSLWSGQLQAAA